jgi:aspartyl-tRNA(Asn)/glutamyl-tRNA(Gln) amidotransferase subunit B
LPVSATASSDTPTQITDSGAIASLIDTIIAANPDQVAKYRAGKDKVFGFVGHEAEPGQGQPAAGQ